LVDRLTRDLWIGAGAKEVGVGAEFGVSSVF
jgi:hypothetical protein